MLRPTPWIQARGNPRGRALAILALAFTILCAASWQSWANLTIDGGREMNLPLRLLRGERIYTDAYFLYGPLAPYLNALLYRLFGVHLTTLYVAGIAASIGMLLLVFRLAQRFMSVRESLLATLAVLVLCVFKQGGNTIFPYTYAALYGTVLGIGALAAQVRFIHRQRQGDLLLAGLLTGLALVCKLEFGLAATASLLTLVASARAEERFRVFFLSAASAAAIPLLTYGVISQWVSWRAIVRETFLLPGTVPTELLYFNRGKLGFNDPFKTACEMLASVALLGGGVGGALLLGIRRAVARHEIASGARLHQWIRPLQWIAGVSLALLIANAAIFRTDWSVNPFRALPLLCVATLIGCFVGEGKLVGMSAPRRSLLVLSTYSLAVLGRVVFRVPSGGAYGACLLPIPIVLFVYLATTHYLPVFRESETVQQFARGAVAAFLALVLAVTSAVILYRYQKPSYFALQTARGAVRTSEPTIGAVFDQTLHFIAQFTRPGDGILAVPEGSSLNFLADRPAPLRYEILTPGFVDAAAEQEAIRQLQEKKVKFVFLLNRPTSEFGPTAFGRDYCQGLMRWIDANYRLVAVFGDGAEADSEIGTKKFFVKCYAPRVAGGD